ncbi:Glycosyl hydrolase family 20, catalytic domain [Granulicella pectinivorans]|uniref:beta-N-acetylhexosaminidase n=1 Tax=Granulicella pectinivorans TaxID=474950 RepID=A0A1I6MT84_9BACT|nr:family 20 glycosylhydrolase [Granulicella pectinivorans]SFS18847.1 Glycosyl hydrolase family 20, catalytic domain [Granulicella pectinivorans]
MKLSAIIRSALFLTLGTTAFPQEPALVPLPREVRSLGSISLAHGLNISVPGGDAEDKAAAADLAGTLKERGIQPSARPSVHIIFLRVTVRSAAAILARNHIELTPAMHDEGYAIVSEGNTTYDIASTSAGIFYGAQTLAQLITVDHSVAMLHAVILRDWPAMKYRGLSHDLSRGPISTLAFQQHIIRVLAQFKANIYSPYCEVSLAYPGNPLPAPYHGAMTPADVAALVAYAKPYHVTIIPEQEAFGHLHHALMFEQYSSLAETPHGSALAPQALGSIELIDQWFRQIATMFPGPFLHVGGDEVNELGLGQSKERVAQQGEPKTYMDFLMRIHAQLQPLKKKLLFWGDIAMSHPDLVKKLPSDMIAVAWDYDPRPQGFDKWIRPFTDIGMETWVAPGINNWNRIYPNNDEALRNIQGFVSDGQRLGATGELNTMWNVDEDNEGLFNNNWYGVLFGAAAGWQPGSSSIPVFHQSFGQVFHGDFSGKLNQAQLELTEASMAFRKAGFKYGAMTDLFWADPWSEQGRLDSAKILPVAHTIRMHAERAITLIHEAQVSAPLREPDALNAMEIAARRIDFVAYKFQMADEILTAYRQAVEQNNGTKAKGAPLFHISYFYQDLISTYGQLRDMYQDAWQKENRSYALQNVMVHYDMSMQLWMLRSDLFRDAKLHFTQTRILPVPQELGMPAYR